MPDVDSHAEARETMGRVPLFHVGAGDVELERPEDLGKTAHPDAADTDEMDVTLTSEHASMHYAGTILSRSQVALVADQSRAK